MKIPSRRHNDRKQCVDFFFCQIKQLFRSLVRLWCLLTQAKAFSGICSCIQALQVRCRLLTQLPRAKEL